MMPQQMPQGRQSMPQMSPEDAQALADQAWQESPTDETASMIEMLAQTYGITPPWTQQIPPQR
jgi:hypothetical protein